MQAGLSIGGSFSLSGANSTPQRDPTTQPASPGALLKTKHEIYAHIVQHPMSGLQPWYSC